MVKGRVFNVLSGIILILLFILSTSLASAATQEECEAEGNVWCVTEECNIGHPVCNENPPSKEYVIPEGERCTFTGTITNSGCAWINPAALTISGNGCNQIIYYHDCENKYFSFTCYEGSVSLSADDSSNFSLTYSCEPLPSICGNGVLETGEECESPSTPDNPYCSQTTETCDGNKLGVRDAYGFCNAGCYCAEDLFTYQCVAGRCGAECSSTTPCPSSGSTMGVCNLDTCSCEFHEIPFCGNQIIDPGEECEYDTDCPENMHCDNCDCVYEPFCGDSEISSGEECDDGPYNGIGCNPGANTSCTYCSTNCTIITIGPGTCGDGKVDVYEQCDAGSSNGAGCSPACERTCYYCDEDCMVQWEYGEPCPTDTPIPTPNPYYPYYYGYNPHPRPRLGVCGNNVIEASEACDDGVSNGVPCIPDCGTTCTYCNDYCEQVVMIGSPCARTPRPWETGLIGPYCQDIILPVKNARLDHWCNGDDQDVTYKVNRSDNLYAKQDACDEGYTYIYLDWEDARHIGVLKQSSVYAEHKEALVTTWLEYYSVCCGWQELCKLPVQRIDSYDYCDLSDVDLEKVSLRIKIKKTGTAHTAFEMLDHSYLNLTYCVYPGVICGNGLIEEGEECDDGNIDGGDGCNQLCKLEYGVCSEWSGCVNGEQTMTCTYANEIKVMKKSCEKVNYGAFILLGLLIILLFLFFLLPFVYTGFIKKKDEEKKK